MTIVRIISALSVGGFQECFMSWMGLPDDTSISSRENRRNRDEFPLDHSACIVVKMGERITGDAGAGLVA